MHQDRFPTPREVPTGKRWFDPWLHVRDVTEFVRHARAFAEEFTDVTDICFQIEWKGLKSRAVAATPNSNRYSSDTYISHSDGRTVVECRLESARVRAESARIKVESVWVKEVNLYDTARRLNAFAPLFEANELAMIHAGLAGRGLEKYLRPRLEQLVSGPESYVDESAARAKARNTGFELAVIARLATAGLTIQQDESLADVVARRSFGLRFNGDMSSLMRGSTQTTDRMKLEFELLSLPLYMVGQARRLLRLILIDGPPTPMRNEHPPCARRPSARVSGNA